MGFETAAGNCQDSSVFYKIYEKIKNNYNGIKNIIVDASYKTLAIAKMIIDDGKIPVMPYKSQYARKGFIKKNKFVYDKYYDCYICPSNEILKYSSTTREGYKEYKSESLKCKEFKFLKECNENKNHIRIISRHVWEEYIEKIEDIRYITGYKELYSLRSQTIERIFADAKELHGFRYAKHRGLKKVTMELNLLFVSMNLKKTC